jgi:acetyl-CoA acetyltransferase
MAKVLVAGVGMIPFAKPGNSPSYDEMGAAAGALALKDAGIDYAFVRQAYAGYVYGDSTCGQKALSPRHDRHPGGQRQQQLFDRIDGTVPGASGRGQRCGRLRAGARL